MLSISTTLWSLRILQERNSPGCHFPLQLGSSQHFLYMGGLFVAQLHKTDITSLYVSKVNSTRHVAFQASSSTLIFLSSTIFSLHADQFAGQCPVHQVEHVPIRADQMLIFNLRSSGQQLQHKKKDTNLGELHTTVTVEERIKW